MFLTKDINNKVFYYVYTYDEILVSISRAKITIIKTH